MLSISASNISISKNESQSLAIAHKIQRELSHKKKAIAFVSKKRMTMIKATIL